MIDTQYKVTQELIDSKIVNATFTVLASGKVIVCELTLTNGFTVRGEASVVDIRNFDPEKGAEISMADAKDKIWVLEGYMMQEKLYNDTKGKTE